MFVYKQKKCAIKWKKKKDTRQRPVTMQLFLELQPKITSWNISFIFTPPQYIGCNYWKNYTKQKTPRTDLNGKYRNER